MTIDPTVDDSLLKVVQDVEVLNDVLIVRTHDLPSAPTDEEKFTYYGRQHRWYIWARTFATLSAATSLLLFSNTSVLTWWFWIPFSIFASYMVLTHYCTTRPRRISMVDHLAITELWRPDHYPSVDVFLPCAGEDLDVLDNTYGTSRRWNTRASSTSTCSTTASVRTSASWPSTTASTTTCARTGRT